jgi:hypothetical protein
MRSCCEALAYRPHKMSLKTDIYIKYGIVSFTAMDIRPLSYYLAVNERI